MHQELVVKEFRSRIFLKEFRSRIYVKEFRSRIFIMEFRSRIYVKEFRSRIFVMEFRSRFFALGQFSHSRFFSLAFWLPWTFFTDFFHSGHFSPNSNPRPLDS